MSDVDPSSSPKAVFLSYTSDDMAVALAVCEALRESGIEVWMDRSELQGGDAWDANIQRQIRECALIVPIISKRTQARREGYFRLEWRLADERMRLVAIQFPTSNASKNSRLGAFAPTRCMQVNGAGRFSGHAGAGRRSLIYIARS